MIGEWFARLGDFFSRAPAAVAIDLVDIALVAYVIYRVLLLIKGTRAMQMGLGLALVFALYQAARIFELVTLFTMMDSLITYVVLIVVVVFQNDIRRVLARVGARPLFRAAERRRDVHARSGCGRFTLARDRCRATLWCAADPCQWAGNGDCDVPQYCAAGDYIDCGTAGPVVSGTLPDTIGSLACRSKITRLCARPPARHSRPCSRHPTPSSAWPGTS